MATTTAAAPTSAISYLEQLNRLAVVEAMNSRVLSAWAEVTPDPEFAYALRLVAAREASHAEVFGRRLVELGGEVLGDCDPAANARLAIVANPALSDADKIVPQDGTDPFGETKRKLSEGVYDPLTANHITWFMVEEYDSLAFLRVAEAAALARASRRQK